MGVITWRNVDAPNYGGVAAIMEASRRATNAGFGQLQDALATHAADLKTQWNQGVQNNTNAFLDALAKYRTPEQLQAAQASGALDALRQQFGNQVDKGAIRNAESNAQSQLIKSVQEQQAYADANQARDQRPLMNELYAKYAAGDAAGMSKLLAEHPELQNAAAVSKDAGDLRHTLFGEKMQQGQLGVQQGQLALSQAANNRQQIAFNQQQDAYKQNESVKNFIEQDIAAGKTEQETRDRVAAKAAEMGWSGQAVFDGISKLPAVYASFHNLTADQQSRLDGFTGGLQANADNAAAVEKLAFDQMKTNKPVMPQFAYGDKNNTSEGDALVQFKKDFNISDGDLQSTQKTWEAFKTKNAAILDKVGTDHGLLLKEALLQTGSNGSNFLRSTNDVSTSDLRDNLQRLLSAYVSSRANNDLIQQEQARLLKAEQARAAEISSKTNEYRQALQNESNLRKAFK